jgi:membrane protease YdiL (CAAX protease family)
VTGAPADFAARLRGFGPAGSLAVAVIVATGVLLGALASAVLVLAWASLSRTPWSELGYVRPRSWARTVALGVASGAAFKLLLKAVVMPLLGADPVNRAYHYLAGNRAALPGILFAVVVGAAFGEETFYRGYLFERLRKLLGTGRGAAIAVLLATSALFAAAHYADQGVAGAEQAAITGLVFGGIFAATRRIWLPICMHAAFDLTAVAIIYWGLETKVAHLVFK